MFEAQQGDNSLYSETRSIPDETQLHFLFRDLRTRIQLFAQALALKPEILDSMTQNSGNGLTRATEMVVNFLDIIWKWFEYNI